MSAVLKPQSRRSSLLAGIDIACDHNPDALILPLWRNLASGAIDFEQLLDILRCKSELTFLTVDSTGVCDLQCQGMCYYHPEIDTRRTPANDNTINAAILDACKELGLKALIFAGKEPLLNVRRLVRLINFAGGLSTQYGFDIGIVTNGRSIAKHWSDMDALAQDGLLTFLDISIDSGIAKQHDAIRGIGGTFMLAYTALERCIHEWPKVRVGTASVLRNDNASGILTLISHSASFNRHFFIAPIQPPPFSETPPLKWSEIRAFLDCLITQLEKEQKNAGLEVIVQLLGLYLWDAEADGFFEWHELQEDSVGQVFIERNIGGNRLILQMQVLPETGWRTARITYDGAYLPNAHFLQHPHPESFAVGYAQEESLPDLYRRALAENSIFHRMLKSRNGHSCRERPCWNSCFGGIAGSENGFMEGAALVQQPRLCLKTDHDFLA